MSPIDNLLATATAVVESSCDELNNPELLSALRQLEIAQRKITAASHALTARLVERGSPIALGGTTFAEVLARHLSISTATARRRLADAAHLGPRHSFTNAPRRPDTQTVGTLAAVRGLKREIEFLRGALLSHTSRMSTRLTYVKGVDIKMERQLPGTPSAAKMEQ